MGRENYDTATLLVHSGIERSQFGETAEAIYLTSGYVYDDAAMAQRRMAGDEPGFTYSRYGNPTVQVFERRLAALEGAEGCYATTTGMSAVWTALLASLKAGDHIVANRVLFGPCFKVIDEFLPRFGVTSTLIDASDPTSWETSIRPNTKVLFLETPANPTLSLIDIAGISSIARAHNLSLIVDNALASPIVQRPTSLGADIVVYSATKHIDGQGRCLGGAVLSNVDWLENAFLPFLRTTGPSLSPFNAWILLKGLETLALRVERASQNAFSLACQLQTSSTVRRVFYPTLPDNPQLHIAQKQMSTGGSLISLDLGSQDAAFTFLNSLRLVAISNNFGDTKTLATHPATTTHAKLSPEQRLAIGVTDGLVRLSIGIESLRDISNDINNALDAVATKGRIVAPWSL